MKLKEALWTKKYQLQLTDVIRYKPASNYKKEKKIIKTKYEY